MPQPQRDAVHRYFTFDELSNYNKCNLCGMKLKGKHTTNLKNHLSLKHLVHYQEVIVLNKERNPPKAKNEKIDSIIELLKTLCSRLVAVNGRPLAMIEDEPFQKILNLAASSSTRSKEINIKAIKIKIRELAYNVKQKIILDIRNKLISIKIDSATCMERRFLGINIQYIIHDKIIIRNLAVIEVYESQTGEYLKESLLEVLIEFNITKEQIYSITTDNGSNMKKMTKLLGGSYYTETEEDSNNDSRENNEHMELDEFNYNIDSEEEEMDNQMAEISESIARNIMISENDTGFLIRGMLCAAHTLQLAVKDGIAEDSDIQRTLELARKVVKILRKPTTRNILKVANLRVPIVDCTTRWTSTYNMLVRVETLREICESIQEVSGLLSTEFWSAINDLITCLKPLNECTLKLQKEQLTIGDFFIYWMTCKAKIDTLNNSFARSVLRAMELREISLLDTNMVLEAIYLDGRLNVVLADDQCEKAKRLLKQTWAQIQNVRQTTINLESSEPVPSSSNSSTITTDIESTSYDNNDFSILEAMLVRTERSRGLTARTMSSLDACLFQLRNSPRLPLDMNIIQHWHSKTVVSQDITQLAMTVLSAPATQVSVERLFSSLKFILHPLRNSLSSSLLKVILFIRSNKDLLD